MNYTQQKGSVIIVVIIVLMSIVALSGIALKVSLNTSETAVNQVAKQMLENSANSAVIRMKSSGSTTISDSNIDSEIGFCLNSSESVPFNTQNYTKITRVAAPVISTTGTGGACKLVTSDSASKLVSTYMTIMRSSDTPATFTSNLYTTGTVYQIVAVSYLNKYATQAGLDRCLGKYLNSPVSSTQMTVSQCLDNENIPNSVKQSKYIKL